MPDDTNLRHGQDRARISLEQDHEVHYWAMEFGVTEEQLRHAVNAAGDYADKVRQHLNS